MFGVTFLACVQLPRSLRFWGEGAAVHRLLLLYLFFGVS